jgi:hypothetical protein
VIGKCKLCLKESYLTKSHILPAAIYKRLRNKNEKNPNPLLISKDTAVQTSKQIWAHLLCANCEQRLNKYGEHWVLRNYIQEDGSFPIASTLAARIPDISSHNNPTKVYYTLNIPEINISALSYFALSIFWRGSIYTWKDDGSIPINLGIFQEAIRHYLLGLTVFPNNCYLRVFVREGKETDMMTYVLPSEGQKDDIHICKYTIPGLAFMLLTSEKINFNESQFCIVHGKGNPIFVTTIIEKLLMDEVNKLFNNHSSTKRK